jgi:exonuclease SbcC
MIIEHLSGTRFGRHEQFDFECDAPVVGLMGQNGSGKSTILSLIQFLLTGEARDNLDSYVKNQEGNGGGTLRFRKNGRVGTIMRQVGKTPKRSLEWDGRKITKAREVDALMAEIFGADKKAVANAVFVQQGELEKILFEDGVERQKNFIKIVNLAYCQQRSALVDQKIRRLQATIEDLGPARQAALEARTAATDTVQDRQRELEGLADWSAAVTFCTQHAKLQQDLDSAQQEMTRLEGEHLAAQHRVQSALAAAGAATVEDLNQRLAGLQQAHQDSLDAQTKFQTVWSELQHYDRLLNEITQLTHQVQERQASLTRDNPQGLDSDTLLQQRQTVQQQLQAWQLAQQTAYQLQRAQQEHDQASRELADLSKQQPTIPESTIQELQNALVQLTQIRIQIEQYRKFQQEIAGCFQNKPCSNELQCPKCGLQIVAKVALSAEGQQALDQAWHDAQAAEYQKQTELHTLAESWRQHHLRVARLQSRAQQTQTNLTRCQTSLVPAPETDEGTLNNQLNALNRAWAAQNSIPGEMARLQKQVQSKTQERAGLRQAILHLGRRPEFTATRLQELQQQTQQAQTVLQAARRQSDLVTSEVGGARRVQALLAACQQRLTQKQTLLDAEVWPADVLHLQTELAGVEFAGILAEVQARHSQRQMVAARLEEAQQAFVQSNERYLHIEARIAQDQVKQGLIQDLIKLKGIVSDSGLPLAWVRYQFEHLARLTQEALVKLQANFSIQIDRTEDLSFSFVRLDEDQPVELPMSKLSGGQRVRLAVAFLMAVQKRLVPEVGLLVLDEPSVHIDEKGVESLSDLLSDASQTLQNAGMQIWVVDHNPVLRRALNKVKELN